MFFWWIIFWRLSDKFGRKNILLLSILSNILWYVLFWLSNNLVIFAIARFFNWFGWWGWSVLQAYIWDISDEKNKVQNLGFTWAASWLWFLLWPIFWYFFIWKELHFIWFISAILLFIAFLACLFFFKNPPKVHDEHIHIKWVKFSKIFYIFFVAFCVTFTIIWLQTIFPFYLKDLFNFDVKNIYITFWYIWIVALIYQVWFLKLTQKFLSEKNMLNFWLICIFISLIFLIFTKNIYLFFVIITIFSIWYVTTNVAISANIITISSKKNLWNNMWLNMWAWSIWEIFWSIIAWSLFSFWDSFAFIWFAIIIFLSLVLFVKNFNE